MEDALLRAAGAIAVPSTGCRAAAELVGVSVSYQTSAERVTALRDVHFSVAPGELVCIHGASGSGKSTLLAVLGGILAADVGEVYVGGVDITELSERARALMRLTTVGMVFQDHGLIDEFTAAENVMLPLEARSIESRLAREQAMAGLHAVGIEECADRFPDQLSGGQRQRVGIARALIGNRSLILADEPTGALDSQNSEALFRLLRKLSGEGIAVVLATHDPLAAPWAHRVLRLQDGVSVPNDEPPGRA